MVKIDSKDNLIRLVNQYKNLIFSICLKMTGDYFVAEDLTQETFILAYQHMEGFDGNNEKAWICRIASNKCIDYLKSAGYRRVSGQEEIPERASNEDLDRDIESKSVIWQVERECNRLPQNYRKVAIDYFVRGISAKEISSASGENLKTVQTKIYRSRDMLKNTIRKEDLM